MFVVAALATLGAVPLTLWGTYELLADFHGFLFDEEEPSAPLSPPKLGARAGDGEARLTWNVPSEELRFVREWEYEQSHAGTEARRFRTKSKAVAHVVTNLTNGVTYSFRVRAIPKTDSGKVAVWSNTVSATPLHEGGDVLERIERHQRGMERHQWSMVRQQEAMAREQSRIADSASVVAAFVAENGEAFRELADLGVDALEKQAAPQESTEDGCTDCPGGNTVQNTHNIHHTTFAFRFAPPWFNADQRSLFTSYVVFPEEAKFKDWISGDPRKTCERDEPPASVCPDAEFYKKAMEPFLKGLAQCATTKQVELHLVGFASSTGLNEPLADKGEETLLEERYDSYIAAESELCLGKKTESERDNPSAMFNLLISKERADKVAGMLRALVPTELKSAFAIKVIPWCSHAAMAERRSEDGGNPAKGLMNRRVEVRLAALPGCLNVDPDNRIDVTD